MSTLINRKVIVNFKVLTASKRKDHCRKRQIKEVYGVLNDHMAHGSGRGKFSNIFTTFGGNYKENNEY